MTNKRNKTLCIQFFGCFANVCFGYIQVSGHAVTTVQTETGKAENRPE